MRILTLTAVLLASSTAFAQHHVPLAGLGDSLGEGVQSADASYLTQPHGYLNLIAHQMGAAFSLPLISSSPVDFVGETKTRSRIKATQFPTNLAVSGATLDSLLNQAAALPVANETDLVLEPFTVTQIQAAGQLHPALTICWIGNNDVLSAVLPFDKLNATQLTSVAQFTADYARLAAALKATGGRVAVGNIPDVLDIGYIVTPQELVALFGSDLGLPAGSVTTIPTVLLIKLGFFSPSILQNPDYVLDSTEIATIEQRIQTFNQIIATTAAQQGFALVDIHSVFQQFVANPPSFGGVSLTTRYNGGLFSLDGVHPSNTGYALVANAFIESIDAELGMNVPPLTTPQLVAIALTDPFISLTGTFQVPGRPFAGLLETLGPVLGISGSGAAFHIDPAGGAAFLQRYREVTGSPVGTALTAQEAINIMKAIFRNL